MYIYWWHAAELGALRVGHDEDPADEVAQYCADHGLAGGDLRGYRLPEGSDAGWLAAELGRELEASGFARLDVRLDGRVHLFHDLDGRPFEEAHDVLSAAARRFVLREGDRRPRPPPARRPERPVVDVEVEHWEIAPLEPPSADARVVPVRDAPVAPPGRRPTVWLYALGLAVLIGLGLALRPLLVPSEGEGPSPTVPPPQAGMPPASVTVLATPPSVAPPPAASAPVQAAPVQSAPVQSAPPVEATPVQPMPAPAEPAPSATPAAPGKPPAEPVRQATPDPVARPAPEPRAAGAVPPPVARPVAPPPAAAPRAAASEAPATAPARPRGCRVSRPKPGLQVYLVNCPNSWAMIGRTVDTPTGWTVSEGANADEAVEFFMHSRHAR